MSQPSLTAPDGLPSWASISGNNLTIAANQFFVVPASTLPSDLAAAKLLANTQALNFLNAFAVTAIGTGFLVCGTACPDWSTLVWDFFALSATTPPAVNTGSVAGDTFQFDMKGRATNAQVFGGAHGSLTYTGEGCNCLLTINITSMETALNSTLKFEVVIIQDGIQILDVILQHSPFIDTNGLVVGVNVIPFTVAAGINSVIEVDGVPFNANHEIIRCGGAIGGLINGQMTFTATVSNA